MLLSDRLLHLAGQLNLCAVARFCLGLLVFIDLRVHPHHNLALRPHEWKPLVDVRDKSLGLAGDIKLVHQQPLEKPEGQVLLLFDNDQRFRGRLIQQQQGILVPEEVSMQKLRHVDRLIH